VIESVGTFGVGTTGTTIRVEGDVTCCVDKFDGNVNNGKDSGVGVCVEDACIGVDTCVGVDVCVEDACVGMDTCVGEDSCVGRIGVLELSKLGFLIFFD